MAVTYLRHSIKMEIVIHKFVTFLYKELAKDFISHGEKHDFWEIVYVDKGELEIYTDGLSHILRQGDLIVYRPDEYHFGQTNRGLAPNIFIVSFECDSPAMDFFWHRQTFRAGDLERGLLAHLIREGVQAFGSNKLRGKETMPEPDSPPPFGSEQMCVIYLEALLIHLIRSGGEKPERKRLSTAAGENREFRLIAEIQAYMESNLHDPLTLEQLATHFAMSRSQLGILFKKHTGCGVKEFVRKLRIDKAKTLIRDELYNMSEISEMLGFSGVHYFSRQFKQWTGMSPSEYARTLKARL